MNQILKTILVLISVIAIVLVVLHFSTSNEILFVPKVESKQIRMIDNDFSKNAQDKEIFNESLDESKLDNNETKLFVDVDDFLAKEEAKQNMLPEPAIESNMPVTTEADEDRYTADAVESDFLIETELTTTERFDSFPVESEMPALTENKIAHDEKYFSPAIESDMPVEMN